MSDLNKIRLLLADPLMVHSEIEMLERQQWNLTSLAPVDESGERLREACLVGDVAHFEGAGDTFGVDVFSHDV